MRYIDPDATVMIHDVSSGQFGKVEELRANADESMRLNKKVYRMMAENIGKHKDFLLMKSIVAAMLTGFSTLKSAKKSILQIK